jgi:uncharacterized protein
MAASSKNETGGSKASMAVINSIEFAKKALELHDIIALSQFSRLHDVLVPRDGTLHYRLRGANENGRLRLHLSVHGTLQLRCQRCLEPFKFELDVDSSFLVVPDESTISILEENLELGDDEDCLVAETEMRVMDLIEDEILLALPLAPKHPSEICDASEHLNELKKPSPFAVLQGWKAGKS